MILRITNDAKENVNNDADYYDMKPELLKLNGTHVFIASRQWDSMIIEATEDIPLGALKHLNEKTKHIEVIPPKEFTPHIIQLLTELFPDKAGTIRKNFLMKGAVPTDVLC